MLNSDPLPDYCPTSIGRFKIRVREGLALGVWLGLGNQVVISIRGVIIWQGVENGHNTGNSLQVF